MTKKCCIIHVCSRIRSWIRTNWYGFGSFSLSNSIYSFENMVYRGEQFEHIYDYVSSTYTIYMYALICLFVSSVNLIVCTCIWFFSLSPFLLVSWSFYPTQSFYLHLFIVIHLNHELLSRPKHWFLYCGKCDDIR